MSKPVRMELDCAGRKIAIQMDRKLALSADVNLSIRSNEGDLDFSVKSPIRKAASPKRLAGGNLGLPVKSPNRKGASPKRLAILATPKHINKPKPKETDPLKAWQR